MPGHNHYPDCTCGWCWNLRGSSSRQVYVRQDSVERARRLLSEYYVSPRRQAASFVHPNAHCPVCGARVYYYQNEFGSRVFFDDLGGDWPKHPCTDKRLLPRAPAGRRTTPSEFVSTRARKDIVAAAFDAGTPLRGTFAADEASDDWALALVTEVWLFADRKVVLANRLHFNGQRITAFSCDDPDDIIDVDDIISLHHSSVSALDPINLCKLVIPAEVWNIPEEEEFAAASEYH